MRNKYFLAMLFAMMICAFRPQDDKGNDAKTTSPLNWNEDAEQIVDMDCNMAKSLQFSLALMQNDLMNLHEEIKTNEVKTDKNKRQAVLLKVSRIYSGMLGIADSMNNLCSTLEPFAKEGIQYTTNTTDLCSYYGNFSRRVNAADSEKIGCLEKLLNNSTLKKEEYMCFICCDLASIYAKSGKKRDALEAFLNGFYRWINDNLEMGRPTYVPGLKITFEAENIDPYEDFLMVSYADLIKWGIPGNDILQGLMRVKGRISSADFPIIEPYYNHFLKRIKENSQKELELLRIARITPYNKTYGEKHPLAVNIIKEIERNMESLGQQRK